MRLPQKCIRCVERVPEESVGESICQGSFGISDGREQRYQKGTFTVHMQAECSGDGERGDAIEKKQKGLKHTKGWQASYKVDETGN